MKIEEMTMADIETRAAEIKKLVEDENADVDALTAEVEELEARKAQILTEAEERKALLDEVEKTAVVIEEIPQEERKMEMKEFRNTEAYIDAYAEMIKGDDRELRALLLSENVSGTVAIPEFVEDRIRADWANKPILSRIRKVFIQGNYKVNYEQSATGAVKHTEGAAAPTEEELVLGTVNFLPEYYKKWIRVSDTVLALRGRAFLDYLLAEFENKIGQAIEDAIVAEITASALSAKVTNALDSTAALAGFAALSDEANNPVVITSKATYASIMNARATTGAKIEDPFNGMEVLFNANVTGLLVGDLDGVVGNFPEGFEMKYIIDEKTYAEQDLVKIVGKLMGDVHLVQPKGFAVVTAA